jgi:hypothetical protein
MDGWFFDMRTGAASSNVRVERYSGPSDWKLRWTLANDEKQRRYEAVMVELGLKCREILEMRVSEMPQRLADAAKG